MKLHKRLIIAGDAFTLNTDDVRLNLFTPGRAAFNVTAAESLTGIVVYSVGLNPQHMQVAFRGYIENSFAIDQKQQRIFCRELPAALNRLVPLSLRNVNLKEVLAAISAETALEFVAPDQEYSQKKAPCFYSISTGYHCMDSLARVYQVPQLIWQQQGNGQVYVGSWEHSYWSGRSIPLPTKWQDQLGVANMARIPVIPKLRPGVHLSTGNIVTQVQISGVHMNIAWAKNPWGTRWTNRSSVS